MLLLLMPCSHLFAQSTSVYRRYFPKIFNTNTHWTGLAVVNLSPSTAALTFKAYSNTGALLDTGTASLQPRRQLAQLVSEILPRAGENAGWLVLESNVPDVEGFFLLFDNGLTVMDGAAASGSVLRDFLVPAGDDGELNLVNPTEASLTCTLEYIGPTGIARPSTQLTVPAMGRTTVRVTSIRPAGAAAGYLRGRSDGLLPLLIIDKGGWLAALAPIDATTQITASLNRFEASKTLYAPQFAVGGGFSTIMDIVNQENASTVLRLKLVGDDGAQLGSTGEVILPPNGSVRISGASIFGIADAGALVQGYVQIQSTDGRFAGWVRFSDPGEATFGSALQFVDAGLRSTYFSQVAQNDLFFTGLAALNPNPVAVAATIVVYDVEGVVIAQGSRQIPPNGRFSKLLPELVGTLPPLSKGYFSMTTNPDLPVASFALFGTNAGDALSAIPPQSPGGSTPSTTTTTSSSTTTTSSSTTSSSATTTTTTTSSSTTVTSTSTTTSQTGTTTTLEPGRPPFSPVLKLVFDTLSAGKTAGVTLDYSQQTGEINVRIMKIETTAGRIDFAGLTEGKVLGTAVLNMGGFIGTVNLEHTVKSNDGNRVITSLTALIQLGNISSKLEVATGLLENLGQDGARMQITISNFALFDGTTTQQLFQFPVPLGSVFVVPSPAGRVFESLSTFTSVLYPSTNGRASTVEYRQTFTITP